MKNWSWLSGADWILTLLTIAWIVALVVFIVFIILFAVSNSKYHALKKQRKQIKRNIDRIENPTDVDYDPLHDIEDDIETKQLDVNHCYENKNKFSKLWKVFLFVFIVCLIIRICLYYVFVNKIYDDAFSDVYQDQSVDNVVDSLGR